MRLAIALAIVLAAPAAQAQSVERGTRVEGGSRYGGFGFFSLGYQRFDTSRMSAALRSEGFPGSPGLSFDLGGGGYFRLSRFIVGGSGQWMLGGATRSGDRRVDARGGYGLFELGFIALDREDFWLYPLAGVGGGGFSYRVASGLPASFNDALQPPFHENTVDTGGLLLEAALGADLFHFRQEGDGSGGPMIGLRVGWLFQPSATTWSSHDVNLAGGPDVRMGGPFVKLVLGGGGFSWK